MKPARYLRALLAGLLAAAIAVALYHATLLDPALVRQLIAQAGDMAPLLFVAGYALATVLFLPGSVLTIAGGALFGPVAGTLYSLTGATLGATLAFLAARYLASDLVARRTGGRLAEFVKGVAAEGWRFVAFVRLVPLLPFNALNYALGLTRIPLGQYVVASYLAMLPGAAAYAYLGYAGREAFAGSDALMRHGLIALALLAAALFLPRLARRLRPSATSATTDIATLQGQLSGGNDVTVVDVRGAEEYAGPLGHIPGSLNIPLAELPARLAELQELRHLPLVLFGKVAVLSGGMTQWSKRGQDAGHPERRALRHGAKLQRPAPRDRAAEGLRRRCTCFSSATPRHAGHGAPARRQDRRVRHLHGGARDNRGGPRRRRPPQQHGGARRMAPVGRHGDRLLNPPRMKLQVLLLAAAWLAALVRHPGAGVGRKGVG